MLSIAARVGVRAWGDAAPNPLVGCVIGTREGRVLGVGHHRRIGGEHAEAEALRAAAERGRDVRGATAWVTLEPCAHYGRTPPCAEALAAAGVAQVVCARRDPHPAARGGAEALRGAGVGVRFTDVCREAVDLGEPFVRRVETGMPWVVAKWAQTLDGRIATRSGESRWISGAASRRRVHRMRAAADAVVVGVGTALADDPMLTARGVARVRRVAARVVLDTHLRLPAGSQLVRSAMEAPVVVFCGLGAAETAGAEALRGAGVEVIGSPLAGESVDPRFALRWLADERDAWAVLVEAGPRLLGSLFAADLVDEAHAFIAPGVMADADAAPVASGSHLARLGDMRRMRLVRSGRCGADAHLILRRS